jgi:glutamine amidotransferase
MCVIILCPPGYAPDFDDHIDGVKDNPDGHGWAMRTPHGLEIWKGMSAEQGLGTFLRAREMWPDDWAMWHSRWATQGTVNEFNCQPFEVPGRDWVMAHNGVLPLSDGPFDERRSDSRIFAEDHVSKLEWTDLRKRFDEIDAWIAPSKVVIMSATQDADPVWIFGEKRGSWEADGCWWSARPWSSYCSKSSKPRWACGPGEVIDLQDEYEDEQFEGFAQGAIFSDPKDFDDEEDEAYYHWLSQHANDGNKTSYVEYLHEVDRG